VKEMTRYVITWIGRLFILQLMSHCLGVYARVGGSTCVASETVQQTILPVLMPPKPRDCDVDAANCSVAFPTEYYSMENILARSRIYLSVHSPFLDQLGHLDAPDARMTNIFRLKNFFARMKACSDPVTILVLGGSLTAGRTVGGFRTAWPALLQTKLQLYRNKTCADHGLFSRSVTVVNRAAPGSASAWAVHQLDHLLSVSADLVIVDYDVNDCLLVRYNDNFVRQIQGVTEILVRKTLAHLQPTAAMVFLNVPVNHKRDSPLKGDCSIYETCYAFDHIRRPVLTAYGVPIVSSKALWSHFNCAPPQHLWPCNKFCSHPTHLAHILLSELVADFVIRSSDSEVTSSYRHSGVRDCNVSIFQPLLRATVEMEEMMCHRPSTRVDAKLSAQLYRESLKQDGGVPNMSSMLAHRDDCWIFTEDVIGKPGWVGYGCVNGSIVFKVTFGAEPVLTVVALTTYPKNTGMIEVSVKKLDSKDFKFVNSATNDYVILGQFDLLRGDNDLKFYSVSTALSFNTRPPTNYLQFFNLWENYAANEFFRNLQLSNSEALVRIKQVHAVRDPDLQRPRSERQKVKIISLQTC
jgi:hypothetical protein